MKPLHIGDGLIDSRYGGGVTYRPFGAVPGFEFGAVGAAQSHLIRMELLSSAGVTGRDVRFGSDEQFDEVGADVALSIAQRLTVGREGQGEGGTIGVVGVLLAAFEMYRRMISGHHDVAVAFFTP